VAHLKISVPNSDQSLLLLQQLHCPSTGGLSILARLLLGERQKDGLQTSVGGDLIILQVELAFGLLKLEQHLGPGEIVARLNVVLDDCLVQVAQFYLTRRELFLHVAAALVAEAHQIVSGVESFRVELEQKGEALAEFGAQVLD